MAIPSSVADAYLPLTVVLGVLAVSGCCTAGVAAHLGTLGPGTEALAVKRLRHDVEASTCRSWVLGVALGGSEDPVRETLERLLASDSEANVVSDVELRWNRFASGLYNRECVTVRGGLGRTIRIVTLPSAGAMPHSHH